MASDECVKMMKELLFPLFPITHISYLSRKVETSDHLTTPKERKKKDRQKERKKKEAANMDIVRFREQKSIQF